MLLLHGFHELTLKGALAERMVYCANTKSTYFERTDLYTHYVSFFSVDKPSALHRIGGPAVLCLKGTREEWWVNDQLHRTDGPALTTDSRQEWWVNDQRHRIDGPAIVIYGHPDGEHKWFFGGCRVPVTDQQAFENWLETFVKRS